MSWKHLKRDALEYLQGYIREELDTLFHNKYELKLEVEF